jgi:hypothetical protein
MTEDQNTEWKASWRDDYLKWICGFANAQGGVLEIGRGPRSIASFWGRLANAGMRCRCPVSLSAIWTDRS